MEAGSVHEMLWGAVKFFGGYMYHSGFQSQVVYKKTRVLENLHY